MPLIKIPELSYKELENSSLERSYLYKDLLLDLEMDVYYNDQLQSGQQLRDLKPIFDLRAVKNSITNIFLTSPGQKILNPLFGIDLRRHLFEQVTKFEETWIRADIETHLPAQEPRIQLENVDVVARPDENRFDIYLQINVPSLNAYGITLEGRLNKEGYYIV
jgi:phage baseplate assembly protein W|tara:strand:+ start:3638 stop:4126 length:489 start_codon:yes stop_codon:yes gene_type:complete